MADMQIGPTFRKRLAAQRENVRRARTSMQATRQATPVAKKNMGIVDRVRRAVYGTPTTSPTLTRGNRIMPARDTATYTAPAAVRQPVIAPPTDKKVRRFA